MQDPSIGHQADTRCGRHRRGDACGSQRGRRSVRAFALQENSGSGLGNAFAGGAAAAEDASTIWSNPAGMAKLATPQVAVAVNLITPSIKFSNGASQPAALQPLGGADGDAGSLNVVPNLYLVDADQLAVERSGSASTRRSGSSPSGAATGSAATRRSSRTCRRSTSTRRSRGKSATRSRSASASTGSRSRRRSPATSTTAGRSAQAARRAAAGGLDPAGPGPDDRRTHARARRHERPRRLRQRLGLERRLPVGRDAADAHRRPVSLVDQVRRVGQRQLRLSDAAALPPTLAPVVGLLAGRRQRRAGQRRRYRRHQAP